MKYNLILIFILSVGVLILYGILGGMNIKEGLVSMENNQQNTSNVNTSSSSTGTSSQNNSTSFDNYNHYKGASMPTIFYSPDGGKLIIKNNENESPSIYVVNSSGKSIQYTTDDQTNQTSDITKMTFYGDDGGVATIVQLSSGENTVVIKATDGSKLVYSEKYNVALSSDSNTQLDESNHNNTLTSYYGSTGNAIPATQPLNTTPNVNNYSSNTQSNGSSYNYSNSLPAGITKNMITSGQEDLYILKSQVVPPVCPACNPVVIYKDTKCQPCPSCERCPEPSFDCRKVPNYNATNNQYLPVPVLNDFSGFGM